MIATKDAMGGKKRCEAALCFALRFYDHGDCVFLMFETRPSIVWKTRTGEGGGVRLHFAWSWESGIMGIDCTFL